MAPSSSASCHPSGAIGLFLEPIDETRHDDVFDLRAPLDSLRYRRARSLLATQAQADGMVPNTSVVIVNEADGEASVSVTNTDASLALLHVTIEDIEQDKESLVFVTPPLSRVEASKTQLVRFILQSEKPLVTQRLKRVIFEGIPQGRPAADAGHARVGVTVRQNLPLILHPRAWRPIARRGPTCNGRYGTAN
jgi:P pilus assembly chaperone PapD